MMECLIGIKFDDYVLLAADRTGVHSILVMSTEENKLHKLSDKLVMAAVGESGDTTYFSEYIAKNMQLYKFRNSYELSPSAAATFARRYLSQGLRSKYAYNVNVIIAGYDDLEGPQLYYMDSLASLMNVTYAAHGLGGSFTLSIMDRYHKSTLNRQQGYELMKECVREIQKRFLANLPKFKVQLIDRNGIQDLPDITVEMLNGDNND